MSKSIEIIVSGHLCLDLLPKMDRVRLSDLPTPGRLFETGAMSISTGGAVSNTGLALERLGVDVRLMSNVGDDAIGRLIVAFLEARHKSLVQLIKVKQGQPSSYTVVLSPENVDRIFLHCTGTNATFGSADIDYSLAGQAKIFHLGYPSLLPALAEHDGADLTALFSRVYKTGTVTSLEMALPDPNGASGRVNWRQLLVDVLPYVDIFIPSLEEIIFMLRRSDYDRWHGNCLDQMSLAYLDALADELLAIGTSSIVGFKLGSSGIYLRTTGAERLERLSDLPIQRVEWTQQRIWHPAFQVNVVGTTGAGDSAYAGFLAALLKGWSPQDATRWACAVGACNVEASDATSGIQTWEATQERLDAGWQTRSERIPD